MGGREFEWKTEGRQSLMDCSVFRVERLVSVSPDGRRGSFFVLDAPDCAMVVPVLRDGGATRFLMVRQYRHGAGQVTLEFPGGVVEPGEDPRDAVLRELEEETGYRAGSVRELGVVSPNPAIQSNRFHIYQAEGLSRTGRLAPDEHEDLGTEIVAEADCISGFGEPPFTHALAGVALMFWMRTARRP
jgi:ADP-ribose pyrophosphatase